MSRIKKIILNSQTKARKGKYGNKKSVYDGITFDSKLEMERYKYLKASQKNGLISNLRHHEKYELHVCGIKIGAYTADFAYRKQGHLVVEDTKCKATVTALFRWKKKHLLAEYDIDVRVVYTATESV